MVSEKVSSGTKPEAKENDENDHKNHMKTKCHSKDYDYHLPLK